VCCMPYGTMQAATAVTPPHTHTHTFTRTPASTQAIPPIKCPHRAVGNQAGAAQLAHKGDAAAAAAAIAAAAARHHHVERLLDLVSVDAGQLDEVVHAAGHRRQGRGPALLAAGLQGGVHAALAAAMAKLGQLSQAEQVLVQGSRRAGVLHQADVPRLEQQQWRLGGQA
jgi:hypothetical protein